MIYIILTFAIIFNAVANIFMKIGMMKIGNLQGLSIITIVQKMAMNYILWSGITCFVIALGAYSYVLSKMNLSIAYPLMTSCGYAIVVLTSILYLKESFNLIQIFGLVSIIAGVWMITR